MLGLNVNFESVGCFFCIILEWHSITSVALATSMDSLVATVVPVPLLYYTVNVLQLCENNSQPKQQQQQPHMTLVDHHVKIFTWKQ